MMTTIAKYLNNTVLRVILYRYSDSEYTLLRRAHALFYFLVLGFFILLVFFILHIREGVLDSGAYIFFPSMLFIFIVLMFLLNKGYFNTSTNTFIITVSMVVVSATILAFTGLADPSGRYIVQRYVLMLYTYPVIIAASALFCKKWWIYGTGLFFISLSIVLYSIIKPVFEKNDLIILQPSFMFSTLSILLILIISMLNRNITDKALEKSEEYANNLEIIVNERTTDLNIALDTMRLINEELSHKNKIAEMNLKLATVLQSGIYPQKPPSLPGWDIAFISQAASGVTGDLYDFFTEEEKFTGVVLVDISGHGISAGLITLLVKSIISRNFTSNQQTNLKSIIEKINSDLFNEIGSVDNYASGVLLRINDNKIEYVNSGHADILLKKSDTKNVISVSPKDIEFKGRFLGISNNEGGFRTVNFKVSTGDCLLLFTDGIIEGKNSGNEEYGTDRIIAAFQQSPDDDAGTTLKYIINDFNRFIGDQSLKDDFTIIAIKKADYSIIESILA